MVRFKAIRVLLAIVVMRDLTLELMDVQTAYLNAPLKERVFMRQPEGYERGGAASVCLLQKALTPPQKSLEFAKFASKQ